MTFRAVALTAISESVRLPPPGNTAGTQRHAAHASDAQGAPLPQTWRRPVNPLRSLAFKMVGATGIEPVTPTMSTSSGRVETVDFQRVKAMRRR